MEISVRNRGSEAITTTLYDLIEAVSWQLGPGREALVTPTVVQLMRAGHVKVRVEDKFLQIRATPQTLCNEVVANLLLHRRKSRPA